MSEMPKTKPKATGGSWTQEAKMMGMLLCYDRLLYNRANKKSKPSKAEISLTLSSDEMFYRFGEEFESKEQLVDALKELFLNGIVDVDTEPIQTTYTLSKEGLTRRFEFAGVYFL